MSGTRGRRALILSAFGIAAGLLVPFLVLFSQYWNTVSSEYETVKAERAGIAQVVPLLRLSAALDLAQAAAVRADTVDVDGIRNAETAVAAAEAPAPPAVQQRWTDLRRRIDALLTQAPTGQDAFHAYSAQIDQVDALLGDIVAEANLPTDSGAETAPLIKVVTDRLPMVLSNGGRVVDLTFLAGGNPEGASGIPVARDRSATAAASIAELTRQSVDATGPDAFAQTLVHPLDVFRTLVDEVTPPIDPLAQFTAVPDNNAPLARLDLNHAVLDVAQPVATELDTHLAARESGLLTRRGVAIAVIAVGGCTVFTLLWIRLPSPRQTAPAPEWPQDDVDAAASRDGYGLMDARKLLGPGELVPAARQGDRDAGG